MSVGLFDADNDVITPAVLVLGFPDGKFDRFALIVAMADYLRTALLNRTISGRIESQPESDLRNR